MMTDTMSQPTAKTPRAASPQNIRCCAEPVKTLWRWNMKVRVIFFASLLLSFVGCHTSGACFSSPEANIDAMQRAISDNDELTFIETLSDDVREKYETEFLIGWYGVRNELIPFAESARILDVRDTTPRWDATLREQKGAEQFVWPQTEGFAFKRVDVEVAVEGEILRESLLFKQELSALPDNSETSPYVRVGEQYHPRNLHPNPERHAARIPTEEERKTWRLVYPYLPYSGELTDRIVKLLQE